MTTIYIVIWCSRSCRLYQRGFDSLPEAQAQFDKMNNSPREHVWVYLTEVIRVGGTGCIK